MGKLDLQMALPRRGMFADVAKPVTHIEKPVKPDAKPLTRGKRGPERTYATAADRQRAYRERKKAGK